MRHGIGRHNAPLLLVGLVLAVAACSSTSETGRDQGRRAGTSASPELADTDTSRAISAPDETAPGATSRAATRSSRTSDTTSGVPGGSASAPQNTKTGVTPDSVAIGYSTTEGVDQTAGAFGIQGASTAGGQSEAQAVVDWVNRNGGLAGHKIVPIYYAFNIYTGTWATSAQAACSTWTEDNKVFAAVVATGDLDDYTLADCMAKRRSPLLKSAAVLYDATFAAPYRGFFYQVNTIWGNRWKAIVDGLVDGGFPIGKLGVIRLDKQEHERTLNDVVRPAFAAHGVKVAAEAAVSPQKSSTDVRQMETEVANAVLSFRTAGVTDVFVLERSPTLPLLVMTSAESQNYRPRYGAPTLSAPLLQANAPRDQMRNFRGMGWSSSADVDFGHLPEPNATGALCRKILTDAGHTYSDGLALGSAVAYCDQTLFLKRALERAPAFSTAGLLQAVNGLGTTYESASGPTAFGPGRHDGIAAVRPYGWEDDCSCLVYTGPARAAP